MVSDPIQAALLVRGDLRGIQKLHFETCSISRCRNHQLTKRSLQAEWHEDTTSNKPSAACEGMQLVFREPAFGGG